MNARKLAEIWDVDGGYHLRVEVGAFQRQFTDDPRSAEEIASYEVIEVLRKIVKEADANTIKYRADTELRTREAPAVCTCGGPGGRHARRCPEWHP